MKIIIIYTNLQFNNYNHLRRFKCMVDFVLAKYTLSSIHCARLTDSRGSRSLFRWVSHLLVGSIHGLNVSHLESSNFFKVQRNVFFVTKFYHWIKYYFGGLRYNKLFLKNDLQWCPLGIHILLRNTWKIIYFI